MDGQTSWKVDFKDRSAYPIHIINGVHQESQEIQGKVKNLGYKLFTLRGRSIKSKETFLDHIAKEMRFPDYFGNNWDALDECLRDLTEWIPASGYVVLFEDAHIFCSSAPNDFLTFIDIIATVADEWGDEEVPLLLILSGEFSLQTFNYGDLKKRICIHPQQSTNQDVMSNV